MTNEKWSDGKTTWTLLALFAALTVTALLAGASRMHFTGWQMARCGNILTFRVAMSMFLFAPAIGALFWLIVRALGRGRPNAACGVLAILAIYFVACGMGMHDPMNAMQAAYARYGKVSAEVGATLDFFDDQLGHWVFWAGFVLGSWVLGAQQVLAPFDRKMRWAPIAALLLLSLALLWVMLTNLWDEYPKTRQDLGIIALAASVPTGMWLGRGASLRRLPMLILMLPAYWGSIAGTEICWAMRGL